MIESFDRGLEQGHIRLVDSGTESGSMVCVMARRARAATAVLKRRNCMVDKGRVTLADDTEPLL